MDELQLLNLQHNRIPMIQHLSHLQNLVLLNLSDNTLSEMTGLEALRSLRVLMLGNNRWVPPGVSLVLQNGRDSNIEDADSH